ncbi:hypothetical protein JCM18899A_33410 [Nocardioides sp. AN3]
MIGVLVRDEDGIGAGEGLGVGEHAGVEHQRGAVVLEPDAGVAELRDPHERSLVGRFLNPMVDYEDESD